MKYRGYNLSGKLNVVNSTISGNSAQHGGGIQNINGSLNVSNSTITKNSVDYDGGGICITQTITSKSFSAVITNSIISSNFASKFGGGIYCNYKTGSSFNMTNSMIICNSANSTGGGLHIIGTTNITNCTFSGNSSTGNGGGIYKGNGRFIMTNSIVSGNAGYDGGGICCPSGTVSKTSATTISNCIVSKNYAKVSDPDINGTIDTESQNNVSDEYRDLFVNGPIFSSDLKLTNGNELDLHLCSNSYAIDAGDNSKVDSNSTDLDGKSRIYGNKVDIGAYEYQGTTEEETFIYSSVVDTLEDSFDLNDGKWSLREAVYYAPEYNTITFAENLSGTITLTHGELRIDKAVKIDGDNRITIDANHESRVIFVQTGTEETPVVLSNLTITNGGVSTLISDANNNGAGIYNDGVLIVTHCSIMNNSLCAGPQSVGTSTYITHAYGGGIFNNGTLSIIDTSITGNAAEEDGGGIYNNDGNLTITNCMISNNSALSGGGLYNNGGNLSVINSQFSQNNVTSTGGGMHILSSSNDDTCSITNCTISDNSATSGGGIYNQKAMLKITNCTIAGNTAQQYGGGIYNTSKLYVYNSIVALNEATMGNNDITYIDSARIYGYNCLSSYVDWSSSNSNIVYTCSPLFFDAENGDYRLCADSQAIDKGNNQYAYNAGMNNSWNDMAGQSRFIGSTIDMGSYEYTKSVIADISSVVVQTRSEKDFASAVPSSTRQIHEWSNFDLELWTQDSPANGSWTFNVTYNRSLFVPVIKDSVGCSGSKITWTEKSVANSNDCILTITISAPNNWTLKDNWGRIGSIHFIPAKRTETMKSTGVPVSENSCNIGIKVAGKALATQAVSVPFDMTDDGKINSNDFIQFAQNYGCGFQDDGSYNPADFDHSGKVDADDFIYFAKNYGASSSNSEIELPTMINAKPTSQALSALAIEAISKELEESTPIEIQFIEEESAIVEELMSIPEVQTFESTVSQESITKNILTTQNATSHNSNPLQYQVYAYNRAQDKILSFIQENSANKYKLETRIATSVDYNTIGVLNYDEVCSMDLKSLVLKTFTAEQASAFEVGTDYSIVLRLSTITDSEQTSETDVSYVTIEFQWTQELADLFI